MENVESKRARAAKRVKEIKGFYNHIKIFVLINGLFYLLKSGWLNGLMPEGVELRPYYFNWVDIHVLIWGGILAIHCLYLYRSRLPFLKKWEERKIKEFMDKERDEMNKSS